ncbi:Calcium uniporter protein [Trypanosoma melophagium]|uniref:Calcium uniporter protein n=1 Tax=Trypanosoma melophagium TaxID=715481 RepID=UPI00351A3EED|nr:Calcium uniporter protein [Trypanosoma melophagium]
MIQRTPALRVFFDDMQHLKRKLRVRCALDCSHKNVLTKKEFIALCTTNPYTPPGERMTLSEASDYLEKLHRAREVIVLRDFVYTNPSEVVNTVYMMLRLPTLRPEIPACVKKHTSENKYIADTFVQEEVTRRRNFWATVSLLSGIQMSFLAYLTFIVYDWDVMEPVCYFITTFTALCVYAYSLLFRRECTFHSVENQLFASNAALKVNYSPNVIQLWSNNLISCGRDSHLKCSPSDAATLLQNLNGSDASSAHDVRESKNEGNNIYMNKK